MDFSFLDDWVEEEAGPEIAEGGEGYRNIWVLAETAGGALLPASLAAMGQGRELADQIGVEGADHAAHTSIEEIVERLCAAEAAWQSGEFTRLAEEKFREIQAAYDAVKKERGIN